MVMIVLTGIWVILGVVASAFADSIWREERPYGEAADYAVAILLALLTGLFDWYLLPRWFGIGGTLRFVAAVVEPALAAVIGLWVMRLIKRRSA